MSQEFVLTRADRARSLPPVAGGTRAAAAYQAVMRSVELDGVYDSELVEAIDLAFRFLAARPDVRAALFSSDDPPARELISCLRAAGVDNWDGYSVAMRIAAKRGYPWAADDEE